VNQSDAYRQAVSDKAAPETVWVNASKLAAKVAPRVKELYAHVHGAVVEELAYGYAEAMAELEANQRAAFSRAIASRRGCDPAEVPISGLEVDPRENKRRPFEELTDAELDRQIKEKQDALRPRASLNARRARTSPCCSTRRAALKGRKIDASTRPRGRCVASSTRSTWFFKAGLRERVRSAIAANRVGKTEGMGGYELTCHLTGEYPDWWTGRRFDRPVRAWAAGNTGQSVKEIQQEKLLGPKEAFGTGLMPRDLVDWGSKRAKQGVADAVATTSRSGTSRADGRACVFKSYDQKRISFEGTEQDVILGWTKSRRSTSSASACCAR
jgi:hypothetical protein